MRLYKISDYMTFLGDEGRDALVAKGMLEGHFTLLGPRSSAGDFFMGPMYYYFITPFLWLWHLDPVGPAIMVALFSVATIFLIYWVGKKFFNTPAGLFAAAIYAVSPLVITYSHSSWNPDILPFFALLAMYMTFKGVATTRSWKYFIFTGLLLGISIQLHYLALLLGFVIAVYLFCAEWYLNERIKLLPLLKHYLEILFGFLIGISPFLAFEMRHGFPNTKAIFSFIFNEKVPGTPAPYYVIVSNVFFRIFARLLINFPTPDHFTFYPLIQIQLWGVAAMLIAGAAIYALWKVKNRFVSMLLGMWLGFGVLLLGFYHKSIYDYLFTFIFPLPALLVGNLLGQLFTYKHDTDKKMEKILGISASLLIFIAIFSVNLAGQPFQYGANKQKEQTEQIAKFVIQQTNNKPFNFALLSKGNSDHAYRYYLEVLGHKPVTIENTQIDPQRKSVTDQLLIVCEDVTCQPLGNSLWEVAGFGRAAIVKSWDVSVVKVYKLTHYTEYTIK
jgi:4-amino-4-deoxy-L-arabinose transferase-like glycosyltransferase